MITKVLLRWIGHVIRMDESVVPGCQLLYEGQRNLGRPKKRFKDCTTFNTQHACSSKELEDLASDRSGWRTATKQTASSFEDNP
ncbi:hypothetical protein BaRGS_00032104 [Batillaria attramentaria]|uniref:Uncharacterized protein n=1 Tax=Batillaria attramentaria TaxID=370345 RepID=A0ABD0JNJ7_9CAEN